MGSEEIAYQNKDITSKVLAENFKGKTFRVCGLDLPGIREVKPTNIPAVKVKLRLDNLSELDADGIQRRLKDKVERNEMLMDEELMEFIILPLSYRKKEDRKKEKPKKGVYYVGNS